MSENLEVLILYLIFNVGTVIIENFVSGTFVLPLLHMIIVKEKKKGPDNTQTHYRKLQFSGAMCTW